MEFCLHYDGKLKSNDNASGKHAIRIALHSQIKALCSDSMFKGLFESNAEKVKQNTGKPLYIEHAHKKFYFLVSEHLRTVVDLDICLLLPHDVGAIVNNGGDLDNRIKTLFDALRIPITTAEIPPSDSFDYSSDGMYCLLQDDKLINKITIQGFKDYDPIAADSVRCTIRVTTKITAALYGNLSFI